MEVRHLGYSALVLTYRSLRFIFYHTAVFMGRKCIKLSRWYTPCSEHVATVISGEAASRWMSNITNNISGCGSVICGRYDNFWLTRFCMIISFWSGRPTNFLCKICFESKTGTVSSRWNHMSAPVTDGIEDNCVDKKSDCSVFLS
jgi:hypothetical protein